MFNDLQFNELKESFFAQVESLVNDLDFQLLKQIIEQPPQFMMQLDQNLFSNVKTEFNNLIEKLDYLNIRKNTKELILKLCIIKSLRYLEDSINIIIDSEIDNLNDKEESLSIQLNRLYEIS
jgi:hypothetical protein